MRKNSKEKIYASLFKGKNEALDPITRNVKERYERGFTKWMDDPSLTETEMRKYLMAEFNVSYTQSHRDMEMIKFMLGNVSNAAKEWHRYTANDMIKQGYALIKDRYNDEGEPVAIKEIDVKRALAMIKAGEAIVKANRLDKEDPEEIPYDDIVPQTFEATGDVSVLGIKPVDNLKGLQDKIRRKYGDIIEDANTMPPDEKEAGLL